MTLGELGNLGELLGGLAVIVSLVYLAVQITQNTRTVRASAYKGVIDGLNQAASLLARDPVLAGIYRRGCQQLDDLDPTEEVQFRNLIGLQLGHFAAALEFQRRGMIDSSEIDPYGTFIRSILATSGGARFWELYHHFFSDPLHEWVESGTPPKVPLRFKRSD